MPLALGETLERRYKIDKKLGEGGFGAVYRAYDTRLDVLCAVKESFDTSQEAARQFKRGASMLASLHHPHLPRVTDFFDVPNKGLYLVMDFVQGEDLLTRIQRLRQPLPEDQVVVWLRQICEALSYIHSQNPPIIHRDIKPQNIIIDQNGKAILVDFGLAKLYESGQRTSTGARGLTPGFAAVEQYGSGATDARSDIYSLGATAYVMLTAQVPPESIQRVVNAETLPSPHCLIRSISEPLSNSIMQALEIDPRRRYQTASAFFGNLLKKDGLSVGGEKPWHETDERQKTGPETKELSPLENLMRIDKIRKGFDDRQQLIEDLKQVILVSDDRVKAALNYMDVCVTALTIAMANVDLRLKLHAEDIKEAGSNDPKFQEAVRRSKMVSGGADILEAAILKEANSALVRHNQQEIQWVIDADANLENAMAECRKIIDQYGNKISHLDTEISDLPVLPISSANSTETMLGKMVYWCDGAPCSPIFECADLDLRMAAKYKERHINMWLVLA